MNTPDLQEIWNDVLESVKVSVSGAIFSTWFTQTYLTGLSKNNNRYAAEVGCVSSYVKTTLESRYFGLLKDTLTKTLGNNVDLLFTVQEIPQKQEMSETLPPLFNTTDAESSNISSLLQNAGLRPGFSFENYAVSSSNQMAWAAADAVSKNPGSAYNPLFIWGGVGVGKTHLMSAIGQHIVKQSPDFKIECCTGEQFTNDIVEGIRNKTTQNFRRKYRMLKALLIDDIQFIAGKDAVQEEFFHTFNSLVSYGAQILLTSDRPPSDISKLEERLRSRFEAGLIVDVSPPDFELRCAILQIKSDERNIELPMDLVQLIAGNIDSARKIEGFLVRLSSETSIGKKEIDEDLIETLLGKGDPENNIARKVAPNDVVAAVSKYYSVGKRVLLGPSRSRPIARPRQVLMYILRTQLTLPLQEVGNIVGGRDHTTVMHAVNKISHLTTQDVQIRQDIRGIKNMF